MTQNILDKLSELLTGTKASELSGNEFGAKCTATGLTDCRLVVGFDRIRDKLPEAYYPMIVIEPTNTSTTIQHQGLASSSISLEVTICARVPGKVGALFGKTGNRGVLPIQDDFISFLWANKNLSGLTKTISNVATSNSIGTDGSLWIGYRYLTLSVTYTAIHIIT